MRIFNELRDDAVKRIEAHVKKHGGGYIDYSSFNSFTICGEPKYVEVEFGRRDDDSWEVPVDIKHVLTIKDAAPMLGDG